MVRAFSITLLLISHTTLADESLYLCEPNEKLIFGCEINDKLISICSSKNLSKSTGYAQYRFGKHGNVEFIYPNSKVPPEGVFFLGSTAYSGGGANIIRFKNYSHEYLIFDSMIRTNFAPDEPNDPEFKAGIVTRHNGKITSTRLCSDNNASIRAAAFEVFEREDFDYDVIP
jgi:hypothetical protein